MSMTELDIPEQVLPAQFFHPNSTTTPERMLILAILQGAYEDFHIFKSSQSPRAKEKLQETLNWIFSENETWPFSFINICNFLNLDPGMMREKFLNGPRFRNNRLRRPGNPTKVVRNDYSKMKNREYALARKRRQSV